MTWKVWFYELMGWAGIALVSAGIWNTLGKWAAVTIVGIVIFAYSVGNQRSVIEGRR